VKKLALTTGEICTKIRQLSTPVIILILMTFSLTVESSDNQRKPASFIPDDEVMIIPMSQDIWLDRFMVEDDKGYLKQMKDNLARWDSDESFAENWSLESNPFIKPTENNDQASYLMKNALKYLDRRLSTETKYAEKNSTMAKVGQAQKALQPDTNVQISKSIAVKFRARLLQGKAYMIVKNPYFDYQTEASINGIVRMDAKKDIAILDLSTEMNYTVNSKVLEIKAVKTLKQLKIRTVIGCNLTNGRWIASADKEILPNLNAIVSSEQSFKASSTQASEQKAQLQYSLPF